MEQAPQQPSYSKLKEDRAAEAAQQNKLMQQKQIAEDSANASNENPVLKGYMNGLTQPQPQMQQRGLEPVQNDAGDASDYTRISTKVANSVPDQATYSKMIVGEAIKGNVNPNDVVNDNNVDPKDKSVLLSLMQGGPQNEQAPMGLNPR